MRASLLTLSWVPSEVARVGCLGKRALGESRRIHPSISGRVKSQRGFWAVEAARERWGYDIVGRVVAEAE